MVLIPSPNIGYGVHTNLLELLCNLGWANLCRSMYWHSRSMHWHSRSMHWHNRSMHWHNRSMHWHNTSMYWHNTSMYWHCRSMHWHNRSMHWHCRSRCGAALENFCVHRSPTGGVRGVRRTCVHRNQLGERRQSIALTEWGSNFVIYARSLLHIMY